MAGWIGKQQHCNPWYTYAQLLFPYSFLFSLLSPFSSSFLPDPDTELAPWFSSGVDTALVLADLCNDGVLGNFAVHDGVEPGSYSIR